MNSRNFFAELKRRNVLRDRRLRRGERVVAGAVATQLFPFLHIAEWGALESHFPAFPLRLTRGWAVDAA